MNFDDTRLFRISFYLDLGSSTVSLKWTSWKFFSMVTKSLTTTTTKPIQPNGINNSCTFMWLCTMNKNFCHYDTMPWHQRHAMVFKLANSCNNFEIWSKHYIFLHDFFIHFIWFYVMPTPLRSHGDFPALLVEEDLRGPMMYYFRQEQASE
jgi:hypothetical protein